MRRWIALAARLYPAKWRERYGEEFFALLEDHNPGWPEFMDVLREALKMQMTNRAAYWKLGGGIALAGAVVAIAISFSLPRIYSSTAIIRLAPPPNPRRSISPEQIESQLNDMKQGILSRTSLESIITRPGLDLYNEERSREPMEDIVERMRTHDIAIQMINAPGASGAEPAFAVSFSYPNQQKAQTVVRGLTRQFIEENLGVNRNRTNLWQIVWPEAPPPPGLDLEVLDPASFPRQPTSPRRAQFAAVGFGLGLLLGLLTAVAMQWPKGTLRVAGFAIGFGMLAIAISLLLPQTYTSTAVMRITPPLVPANPVREIAIAPPAGKLQRLEDRVLSRTVLEGMITNPALDLYKKQRAQKPMEEIVESMRRDIVIRPVKQSPSAFRISFSYPDAGKAWKVVRYLVTRFVDENMFDERELARESGDAKVIEIAEHKVGAALEVIDPPSLPETPTSPDRLAISLAGFALGLILGAIALYFRQHRTQTLRTA